MSALRESAVRHTVESLTDEIGRIVAERVSLRENGGSEAALEANRRRLIAAQSDLTRLLVEQHAGRRA